MGITRAALLKTVRANGYNGEENAEAVKKWVTENLDLTDSDGTPVNIDEAWASVPAKKAAKVEPEAKTGAKMDEKFGRAHLSGEAERQTISAKNLRNMWARKAYEQKINRGEAVFKSVEEAEAFAAHVRLSIDAANRGVSAYSAEVKARDVEVVKALSTTVDGLGGTLVPDEFSSVLIDLLPQFGAAAAVCGVTPMSRPKLSFPRLNADTTSSWQGEGSSLTAVDPATSSVQLTASSLKTLTRVSNQWFRTADVNAADMIAMSMARDQSFRIDRAFFAGDGSAANGNFTGWTNAIDGLSGTKANISSYVVGSGSTFAAITAANVGTAIGRLLDKTDLPDRTFIVCHRAAFFDVFDRIARAGGGNTADILRNERVINGVRASGRSFNGYPVVFSEVMPRTAPGSGNRIFALIGNFSAGSKIGVVNGSLSFQQSDQRYFDSDETAFRMVQDVAIGVHDFGNADSSSANWVASPVVGLAVS